MSIQVPKSSTAYASEILAALQDTGVRQTNPGGKARAFADIVAAKLSESESRQFNNVAQTLVPLATGDSLDLIGDIYGLSRIPRSDSSVSVLDNNFQFYVRTGTFGVINGGANIIVPAGTRLVGPDNTVFVLDNPYTLSAASSIQSVSAVAVSTGSQGNAAAGVVTNHNFVNYTDAAFGSLLVTNNFGIVGGRDEEDDDSFRFRISLRLQSTGGSAESDLRGLILQLPGIQDIVFSPLVGTYLAYVYGISPQVPPTLLQAVQDILDSNSAYPLTGTALVPDLIGISLSTTVTLAAGLSQAVKSSVLQSAANAVADYINNLATGAEIVINEIADKIQNADTRILDVGDPNKPLQEIFIWRSRLDNTRYSRFLVNNYTPKTGERVVVENITNAINLTANG